MARAWHAYTQVLASLVDVLWHLRRNDEACALLGRQLELQAQQENIDPVVLAQVCECMCFTHGVHASEMAA